MAMDLYMDVLMSREHMDVRSDYPSPAPFHTGLGIPTILGGHGGGRIVSGAAIEAGMPGVTGVSQRRCRLEIIKFSLPFRFVS